MRNILFILGSFLPKPSANGVCINEICVSLIKEGYKPVCLVSNNANLLAYEQIDGIEIYRVKGRLITRFLEKYSTKSNQNKFAKIILSFIKILNKIKNLLFITTWPLISPMYTRRLYSNAKKLQNLYNFDYVVSVYTPIDSLIVGKYLKKKHRNINAIAYFLDPLSAGFGPKYLSQEWTEKRGWKWEKRLFPFFNRIIFMDSHKNFYQKERYRIFEEKIIFLDIPLFKMNISEHSFFNDNNKIYVCYVGSIKRQIRNPSYLIDIFSKNKYENIELHIFGPVDCPDLFIKNDSEKTNIFLHGHVNRELVPSILFGSSILINFGNLIETLVPSKIFEYIGAGKPIISFYKNDNDSSIPYLKKYPLALLIKENYDIIDYNSKLILKFINENSKKTVSFDEIYDIYEKNTTLSFIKLLESK